MGLFYIETECQKDIFSQGRRRIRRSWKMKKESEKKKNGKSDKQFTADPCVGFSCDRLCFPYEGGGFLCGRKLQHSKEA